MNAYDFDDTIYRGDSSLHFSVFYLRREPGLVRYLPTVIKILRDYHKEKIQFGDITARFGDVRTDCHGDIPQAISHSTAGNSGSCGVCCCGGIYAFRIQSLSDVRADATVPADGKRI